MYTSERNVRIIMTFARFGRQSESVKPIEFLCKTTALLLVSCAYWPAQISPKYKLFTAEMHKTTYEVGGLRYRSCKYNNSSSYISH
mmetsp:Transcript_16857/g.26324  ORF Transcript_16857/g.26324 Transcript_16857/m.26324 type:complete len:86 (-) Transcript_16857:905-1162(-)